MKKHLPLLAAICCSLQVTARPLPQLATRNTPQAQKHLQMQNHILQQQYARTSANKTTATPKRLIATSYQRFAALLDSTHNYYSGGRGSTHTLSSTYTDNYYPTIVDAQQNIFCDSSMHWMDTGSDFELIGSKFYEYDANNRVIKFTIRDFAEMIYEPTYGSNGLISTVAISDTFGGTPMARKSRTEYEYNAQNKRIKDSTLAIAVGNVQARTFYNRDVNGNLLSYETSYFFNGTWHTSSRMTNTYDANNRMTSSASAFDMGAGIVNFFKDSFEYAGTTIMQPVTRMTQMWDDVDQEWDNDTRITTILNAQNLADTEVSCSWAGAAWDTIDRMVYHYDANNLLQYTDGFRYIANTFETNPYDHNYYYYEDYFPTGITNTTAAKEDVIIYPNPATDAITVKTTVGNSIHIYALNGTLIHTQQQYNDKQTIDIHHLQPGTYILSVRDKLGTPLSQQQFTKL